MKDELKGASVRNGDVESIGSVQVRDEHGLDQSGGNKRRAQWVDTKYIWSRTWSWM